jgi:primosomal protein N'
MDYKARDRILTLIIKLQSLLKDDGELLAFYDSNLFDLSTPLNLTEFYDLEISERKLFKFPPYFNIVYVICDTTQLKLDYLFGKLAFFLREYKANDVELFKREEFSRGILTIKIKDKDLGILKSFFDKYKDKIKLYINPRKDVL